MSELGELLAALHAARSSGKQTALATVVGVDGPAYRGAGAKMLIEEGGGVTCMISGGCLEGEVDSIAQTVIASGRSALHHFDLDEDVLWGLGIGCGGAIEVFIEPVGHDPLLNLWIEELGRERSVVLATAIDAVSAGRAANRLLLREGAEAAGTLGSHHANEAALEIARQKLAELHPRSETLTLPLEGGDKARIFFDVSLPPPELVLFGAGHDALPLASLARTLGFKTTVVDARRAFTTTERFPGCTLVLSQATRLQENVPLGRRSYAVVMNHHLERDRLCLRFALESEAPYVGVLGPLSRYHRLRAALGEEGFSPTPRQEAKVYSPVGLDLGAEPPEEVALSILAEVLAIHKGHTGGFLRGHEGRIHVRERSFDSGRGSSGKVERAG